MRAGRCCRLDHAGAQTLARHFHETKAGNPADLDACAIRFQPVLDALFDRDVVAAIFHVDEVDDDQPGKVAQPQLPRDFFGGLKVGLERCFLDRAFLGCPSGVHVDGHKRLGHADDDIAAGTQLNRGVEHAGKIAFDLITREQGQGISVVFDVLRMRRHEHFHVIFGDTVTFFALDQYLVDFAVIEVADRAFDQAAFFVDRRGGDGFQGQIADLFPLPQKIVVIAANFRTGALCAGGPNDQPCTFRHLDLAGDFLELLAVRCIGDLARNATATRRVRHQYAIAARQ